jgi:hypothetical protein
MSRRSIRVVAPLVLALSLACEGEPRDFLGGNPNTPPGQNPTGRLAFRIGDVGADQISDLAVDAAGAVYVTGTFTGSVDFDPGTGLHVLTSLGGTDVFVARYSASNALVWAVQIGGSGEEASRAVTLDSNGDVLIAGWFEGTPDFDGGAATVSLTSAGGRDGFVAKLSNAGALAWARRFGGPNADELIDVASSGTAVYAGGFFEESAEGSPNGTAPVAAPGLGQDIVVLSFDGSGASQGAFALGGPGEERASGITVAGTSLVISGNFADDLDLDPGPGLGTVQPVGTQDGFLAGFSLAGALQWIRTVGGTGEVVVTENGLSFGDGTVQLIGTFTETVDLDSGLGTVSAQSQGLEDIFVLRVDPSGSLEDAFTIGSTGSETPLRAAADGSALMLAGTFTTSLDVDPGTGLSVLTPIGTGGATDAFVVRYSSSGPVTWARSFGGLVSGAESGTAPLGLGLGSAGQVVVGGRFFGTMDVDPSNASFALTSLGAADGFLARFTSTGALATAP